MEDTDRRVIGRYELHRRIAYGGMATVHLGRMRSTTGFARTVALKRMHPHFSSDPSFVAMFFDEARLAMRLHHPNVVQTFDVVSSDDELLLVMEYIHGESLAGLARALGDSEPGTARVPPSIASAIMCGVLSGLHAAHEARGEDGVPLEIVHRDVTPHNVLVGVDGMARLVDFGIAKATGRVHATQQGQVKGKLGYMAPEQLTGGDIDRRADVYGASVVLWEALTGRRLFKGDNPGAQIQEVLTSEVAPPSRLVAGLPAALDDVVLRGLSRQKRERFGTAHEMAAALEAALPLATPRGVGAWVEERAAKALAERASLVAEVERPRPREDEPDAARLRLAIRETERSGTSETSSALIAGEHAPVPGVPGPVTSANRPRKRRTSVWLLAAVILGAALATVTIPRLRRGVAATRGATASDVAREPAPATDPAPTLGNAPAPALASATPAPWASPVATASPAARPHARSHPAPSKPDCSNPFIVDSRGLRVPRPECF